MIIGIFGDNIYQVEKRFDAYFNFYKKRDEVAEYKRGIDYISLSLKNGDFIQFINSHKEQRGVKLNKAEIALSCDMPDEVVKNWVMPMMIYGNYGGNSLDVVYFK